VELITEKSPGLGLRRYVLSPKGKIGHLSHISLPKFYLIFLGAYLNFSSLHLHARFFLDKFPFLIKNFENKILGRKILENSFEQVSG
jgi:hypothetical protein